MRYNIHGYMQDKAIEFGLNNDELLILRHFEDFVNSGKMDSFYKEGRMFYWVNYDAFLKNLPILGIKKDRLGDIMIHNLGESPEDLEEQIKKVSENTAKRIRSRKYTGILKSETIRNKDVGVRSYFAFTKKFYELKIPITTNDNAMNTHPVILSEGCNNITETHPVILSEGIQYNYRNKDSSIRDTSINDSSIRDTEEVVRYVKQTLGEIGPNNTLELLSFLEDGVEADVIIRAIDLAIGNGKRNYNYVKGILNNWISQDIKKSAQLTEHLNNKKKKFDTYSIADNDKNYNNSGVNNNGKCSTDNDKEFGMDSTSEEEVGAFTDTSGIDWSKY